MLKMIENFYKDFYFSHNTLQESLKTFSDPAFNMNINFLQNYSLSKYELIDALKKLYFNYGGMGIYKMHFAV